MSAFDLEVSDSELAAATRGEASAQSAIYRRFERPAFTLARRMVNDPDGAADVLQDAFVTAFRTLHQFRGDAPFGRWLRRVVVTQALMYLRAQRRWQDLFVPTNDVIEAQIGQEDLHTLDLERVLSTLPDVPRTVLWLYHVEGYTHVEIAALCDRTVSFSKSQLSRAHARLRQQFGGAPSVPGASSESHV
ncbi:sigma-70 family RNA polymerase sigma factor [Flagellatimonas centrodinii]|uniref:RNA polymerase sigma factor n=1 Tax=Flagellatimonas centrodinii TaxID=2806210 RepID=UPI001FEDBEF0|nr:sigma-70 family RNA polymerase sigma factor [Flagellatimonas centrodinii]ULQ47581.1 sigma-70 family RNA polymerase sigma factor [Flagellatimonas centrodinii]